MGADAFFACVLVVLEPGGGGRACQREIRCPVLVRAGRQRGTSWLVLSLTLLNFTGMAHVADEF